MMLQGPITQDSGIFTEDDFYVLQQYLATKLSEKPLTKEETLCRVDSLPSTFPPSWRIIWIKAAHQECTHYVVDLAKSLGKGAQGEVFLGQSVQNPEKLIAVKQPNPKSISLYEDLQRERRNLELAGRFIAIAKNGAAEQFLLMDYYPGKNLLQWLYDMNTSPEALEDDRYRAKTALPFMLRYRFALLIVQRVIELHLLHIAHRDLKTANIIVDVHGPLNRDISLHLIDLGSGIFLDNGHSEKCREIAGTFGYNDPALFAPSTDRPYYNFNNDLFSLGIVIAEIFTEYNYQHALKQKAKHQSRLGRKVELSYQEFCELMPDVMPHNNSDNSNKEGDRMSFREPGAIEKAHPQLFNKIKNLIAKLVSPSDPLSLKALHELYKDLESSAQLSLLLNFSNAATPRQMQSPPRTKSPKSTSSSKGSSPAGSPHHQPTGEMAAASSSPHQSPKTPTAAKIFNFLKLPHSPRSPKSVQSNPDSPVSSGSSGHHSPLSTASTPNLPRTILTTAGRSQSAIALRPGTSSKGIDDELLGRLNQILISQKPNNETVESEEGDGESFTPRHRSRHKEKSPKKDKKDKASSENRSKESKSSKRSP